MISEFLNKMPLGDVAKIAGLDVQLGRWIDRLAANESPDDFARCVERDIEAIIGGLESGAKVREKDGEDRLTDEIVQSLRHMGYQATRDEGQNGNCDVTVRSRDDRFLWLAEAKIHKDYDYLWDGFLQLTTRYSTGTNRCSRGAMLIYIRNFDAKSVMDTWLQELAQRTFDNRIGVSCQADPANPLRLDSVHPHKKSGQDYGVRHFGIVLHVGAEDKSARETAARAKARDARAGIRSIRNPKAA